MSGPQPHRSLQSLEREDAAVRLRAAGLTTEAIAQEIGVHRSTVSQILARHQRWTQFKEAPRNLEERWTGLFGVRATNALRNYGIDSEEKLAAASDEQLLRVANFGRHSLRLIRQYVPNPYPPAEIPEKVQRVMRAAQIGRERAEAAIAAMDEP